MRKILYLIFFLISISNAYSQLSKTHYLPPVAYSSASGSNAIPTQGHYFYISTPSVNPVNFNIYQIGGATISGVVSNAVPYTYTIDAPGGSDESSMAVPAGDDATLTTSIIYSDKGYIIEAEQEIYVAFRIKEASQAGALVSKGTSALGSTFRAGTFTSYNPQSNYLNFISVMASEDNTQVTINDLDQNIDILDFDESALGNNGLGNLNDIVFTLNRGQSYIIALRADQGADVDASIEVNSNQRANGDGLIGALISSNKSIVVNSGSLNGSFYEGNGRDYGFDQIVDLNRVGSEYIFVKGGGSNDWENVLIVAHTDNTSITINGSLIPEVNSKTGNSYLNAGEYLLIEGDKYSSNNNMYVQSSQLVFAYQGIAKGSSEANQGFFFVPPLKCSSRGNVNNIPFINKIGTVSFTGSLNIISKTGATITISDDNNVNNVLSGLSIANSSGPFSVNGNISYQTYTVSNLSGNVSINSNDELYVSYYNQNGVATSGAFYSGFTPVPDPPSASLAFTSLGVCIPNVTLQSGDMTSYDSFEWMFDGGSGYSIISGQANSSEYTPTNPGYYKIRAYVNCSGESTEILDSSALNISACPSDFDSDGILDNVDLDIDNDGIYNTEESKGLATLNLVNSSNPVIVFSDLTSDSSVITSTVNQISSGLPNTFTGQSNGLFTSNVKSGTDQSLVYAAASNSPINLFFSNNPSVPHSIFAAGETFIIKVNSPDKTVTLTDPSSILLIDTNYDGSYSSGITSITLNEIKFKFNPTPSGVTPFTFRANSVNGFVFTHQLNNSVSNSTFNGFFTLSSYDLDTDLDGTYDAYDLDSDNDGCSDTLEAGFTDPDGDSILGNSSVTVNSEGVVLSQGGYTTPLDSDVSGIKDFQEVISPPVITGQSQSSIICEGSDTLFAVTTNYSSNVTYQWQSTPSVPATLSLTAKFDNPSQIAIDANNNLYVTDQGNHKIRKISPDGVVTTLAGSTEGFTDGLGTVSKFSNPIGVVIDTNGNIYVADYGNHKIRKISSLGVVSTFAGSTIGYQDGTGTAAKFNLPHGIGIDSNNNLYVADSNNDKIRKITPAGVVTAIAGSTRGYADATGTAAKFNNPYGIGVDSNDNVYVADTFNDKIRKITPAGIVTTIAGSTPGYLDATGTAAQFYRPTGLTFDSNNNLYVTDQFNHKIRKITPTGVVTTFAGSTQGHQDTASITWTDITNNTIYNGATSSQLSVVSPTLDISGTNYRVVVKKTGLVCTELITIPSQLTIDAGSFVVSTTTHSISEGASTTTTLPILLNSKPTGNVVFDVTNPDVSELNLLSTPTITFTPENWNIPQNLIFEGVIDGIRDGDVLVPLRFSVNDGLSADCYDDDADAIINITVQDINLEECTSRSFLSSDFISVSNSSYQNLGIFNITEALGGKNGSVWFQNKLDLRVEFTLNVDLYMGSKDGNGADGIAFVVQNLDQGQGTSGGGLGYGNSDGGSSRITPSYAIEFDTYQNGWDPGNDHIALVQDGYARHDTAPVGQWNQATDLVQTDDLENGQWHNVIISWNPETNVFGYLFTHSNGTSYSNSKVIDIRGSVLNSNIAYWGFTASTGGFNNLQRVRFDDNSICVTDEILTPTGTASQTFCGGIAPTLADFEVTTSLDGGGLPFNKIWFGSATGTDVLAPNTPIVNGTTYYVEAANLSDPTNLNYRQSNSRLAVEAILTVANISIAFAPITPSSYMENSTTNTFTIVLDTSPGTSSVVIDISSSNTQTMDVSQSRIIFTDANWNVTQTINIIPVDNILVDGTKQATLTVDVNNDLSNDCYDIIEPLILLVTIPDDEVAGYTVSPVDGSLLEASAQTVSFTVVLTARPVSDVIVNTAVQDLTEVISSSSQLTFTADNWNIPQTIFLSDVDEFLVDGDQTTQIIASIDASSDIGFSGLANQAVSVVTEDNDISGIILSSIDNLTSENGDTGAFGIKLSSQPSSTVTIAISSSNIEEGTVQSFVQFDSSNWDTVQVITVTGIDDIPPISDGAIEYKINLDSLTTIDADYSGLDLTSYEGVSFINQDNDAPGIFIKVVNNDSSTDEFGSKVRIQFELLAQPTIGNDVTIPLSIIGAIDEVIFLETSITIKNEDWNNGSINEIVITGVDDKIIDGDQKITLVTGDPISGDILYNAMTASSVADVDIVNQDNDKAGIKLSIPSNVSEDLTSTKIEVSLDTEILSDVIINITVIDNSELSLNISKSTFTSSNSSLPQTIIVTGVDDTILDGSIASAVIFTVDPIFSENAYAILDPIEVLIINEDNEKDEDSDTIEDKIDNCISISNIDQKDTDSDGIGDMCDNDIDGDGVLNTVELSDKTDQLNPCSFMAISITLPVSIEIDCDLDGIPNSIDLDDDNDGILDIEEGDDDLDNDGIPNYLDLESDNDNCFDVLEAGNLDLNGDGMLGDGIAVVDSKGLVLNYNGYNLPLDLDYNGTKDYKEKGSSIEIIAQPISKVEIIQGKIISLLVKAVSAGSKEYQWQVNTQGTSQLTSKKASWIDISDDIRYKGTQTETLYISNSTGDMAGWRFRVVVSNKCYVCSGDVISDESELILSLVFIPNAFSPDGDGVNDTWEIDGFNRYPSNKIIIYNRWEEKVYETNNYQNDWNGISNISANTGRLPEGTYFYYIDLGEDIAPLKGYVYIKRRIR